MSLVNEPYPTTPDATAQVAEDSRALAEGLSDRELLETLFVDQRVILFQMESVKTLAAEGFAQIEPLLQHPMLKMLKIGSKS